MSLLLRNYERTSLKTIIAAMAIFIAVTPSAYGINIEYQLDPADNEMMADEDNFNAVSFIQEIKSISYDEKTNFLAYSLKISENQPDKQYNINSQESEKVSSLPTLEEYTFYERDVQAENIVQVLKEKHKLEEAEEHSSTEKKTDRDRQDNKPVDKSIKYSIQVNSYSQKINADDLVRQLKKVNYESFSSETYNPLTKKTHYRVFVGKYSDLQSAKKACELLKKKDEFTDNIFVVNQNWVTGD